MGIRSLRLTILEEDGETNPIWVAAYPIRAEDEFVPGRVAGTSHVWPADKPEDVGEFFKEYIVREWDGIVSGRR